MRLKCDRCGWITDYEFPTREIQLHANDECEECGCRLLKESEIQQALILADLEDKGLMLPVGADSDRAMILIDTDGVKANDKSTEPENRRRAATRDLAACSAA